MTKPPKKRSRGARCVARRAPHDREVDELFRLMNKALMERALAGELTHHLGYAPGGETFESVPRLATRARCWTSSQHGPANRAMLPIVRSCPKTRAERGRIHI